MGAGVRGRLISTAFAETALHTVPGAASPPVDTVAALEAWSERREALLGPASSIRVIADAGVIPLLRILGFSVGRRQDERNHSFLEAVTQSGLAVPIVIVAWNDSLERVWRGAVVESIRIDARWCFCSNGRALRVVDGHRTWARQYLEFDLALAPRDVLGRALLWNLLQAGAMSHQPTVLEHAAALSARHGTLACKALGDGVLTALDLLIAALAAKRGGTPPALFDQSLTVLYRVLFLLFAEARGLVPMWHPIYRERYSIDAIVRALLAGRRCPGIWQAVLAISRLAHAGCSAGELTVTPFNGRLFSPAHSNAFDRARIDDGVMGKAVMAVSTMPRSSNGRSRISYKDLDVEQLGAVYERVLDYEPTDGDTPRLSRTGDARRSSGSFYTPRAVAAFLVRQALEPLIRDRTADEIMRLRVLDPAMGSGAFLVATCRYLAAAAEERLVSEGRWHEGDISSHDRSNLRRQIAQRCLFGVDLNPMAVQLARLSIWLASLASDKPLTFLDHHLVVGNSLVGATLDDVWRQPTRTRHRSRRSEALPLFDAMEVVPVLQEAVRTRLRLAAEPDDSPDAVHAKEKTLSALHAAESPLGRWSAVLDLWCAGWFWSDGTPPDERLFGELVDRLLGTRALLPSRSTDRFLEHAARTAARHRFLHWRLAFPEAFLDGVGEPRPDAGFDAIIGNPPWDMIRGDSGDGDARADRRLEARQFTDFIREAGVYRTEIRAHVNRYQLFAERALQLVRLGGRIGLVLPMGVMTDAGSASLRQRLFSHADIDTVTGLDNRAGIFPVHRSLRFVLLTATPGRATHEVACRFGITRTDELDNDIARPPLRISRALCERLSGPDDLAIPEVVSDRDLRIVEKLGSRLHGLSTESGWHVQFGRELNVTDDKHALAPSTGAATARPVLEGKHIEPFRASTAGCRLECRHLDTARRVPRRARLAYRDVASATNRLTLIAAIVPARAVTTHTLFCLRNPLDLDAQHVLCALLNSFVANYLVRLRVNTHVTVALVSRLLVPVVRPADEAFSKLGLLSRTLASGTTPVEEMPEYASLQALAARLYGLTRDELAHVLETFPLVPDTVKERTLQLFSGGA